MLVSNHGSSCLMRVVPKAGGALDVFVSRSYLYAPGWSMAPFLEQPGVLMRTQYEPDLPHNALDTQSKLNNYLMEKRIIDYNLTKKRAQWRKLSRREKCLIKVSGNEFPFYQLCFPKFFIIAFKWFFIIAFKWVAFLNVTHLNVMRVTLKRNKN